MDTVVSFLKTKSITTSGKFLTSGQSKRGWAALLIAAADSRVVGTMSIAFDFINIVEVNFCQLVLFVD